jgi:hypothetical protein
MKQRHLIAKMMMKMRKICLQIIQVIVPITQAIAIHEITLEEIESGAETVTAIEAVIAVEIEIAQAAESAR